MNTTVIGLAIKCFECNSHFNEGCAYDKVPSNFSVDCSSKRDFNAGNQPIQYSFCRKILQVIEFSVNQCKQTHKINFANFTISLVYLSIHLCYHQFITIYHFHNFV